MDYPRVTEIIRPFVHYEGIPKHILNNAAARGTAVHAICASIAKGAFITDGMIEPSYLGYIRSFRKWAEAQVKSFDIIETRYCNDILGYTGQIDFVITATDNKRYLVDLKTSSGPQKTYPIQMGAYEMLLKAHGIEVDTAWIVYLDKDGEFPDIHVVDDMEEKRQVFKSCVHCYKYFNKPKRKKNDKSK